MATPGFGFSVGDFISGIQLTAKVIDALRTSNSAPEECKRALILLQTLRCLLQQFVDASTTENDECQAAIECAKAAIICVHKFARRIGKLEQALGSPRSDTKPTLRQKLSRMPSKLKWTLCTKEELASFTTTVMPHVSMIQLYLQMQHAIKALQHQELPSDLIEVYRSSKTSDSLGRLGDSVASDTTTLCRHSSGPCNLVRGSMNTASIHLPVGRIMVVVQLDDEKVHQMLVAIEKLIRHIWCTLRLLSRACYMIPGRPSTALDSDIILTDGLGRILRLPFNHFQLSWELLLARLNVAFQDSPGKAHLQRGEYVFVSNSDYCAWFDGKGLTCLDQTNWSFVRPGAGLVMVMLDKDTSFSLDQCPTCGLPAGDLVPGDTNFFTDWAECFGCGTTHNVYIDPHLYDRVQRTVTCPFKDDEDVWCGYQDVLHHEDQTDSQVAIIDDHRFFKYVQRYMHTCQYCDEWFRSIVMLKAHWRDDCITIEELSDSDDSDEKDQHDDIESLRNDIDDLISVTSSDSSD